MLAWERSGLGFPLVLVHGFFGSGRYWSELAHGFVQTHEVITLDLPGLGDSAALDPPTYISDYADLLKEHLESLGVSKFILVGHSLGSMVSLEFANRYGEMLAGLVLYGSTSAVDSHTRHESFDVSIERVQTSGVAATAQKICSSWFYRSPDEQILQSVIDGTRKVRAESAVKLLRMVKGWRFTGDLTTLKTRTLVACGDKDRSTVPTQSIALWQTLPNADLMMLPLCGHAAHVEAPVEFSAGLRRFIGSLNFS